MTLHAVIARCPGVGSDSEGWREGCDDCLRRTAEPNGAEPMEPDALIVFMCPSYLAPRDDKTPDLFGGEA